ncbi:MAG: S-layer homology domain-containing protein [Tissierellia bacterium]|nr:S-layer homology domain-containing protein [Tissierellia bacterium]
MNKKFLSLVLALVMVLGAFGPVLAAEDETLEVPKLTSNDAKLQWLQDREIVIGRAVNADPENTDLALDETITRAEVTKLLVHATGKMKLAEKVHGLRAVFPDVEAAHWANGVVNVASKPFGDNELPLVVGYPDGSFRPKGDVTYAELAKMLVVAADETLTRADHDKANDNWPFAWMNKAEALGIFDGLKGINPNDKVVRKEGFVMLFNAMYKLEDIEIEAVGDDLGIAVELNDNELVLNQDDYKKVVKVSDDTNFVAGQLNGTLGEKTQEDLEDVLVGALIRVITDEDGVASHLVVLGDPEELAVEEGTDLKFWRGLGDAVVETAEDETAALEDDAEVLVMKDERGDDLNLNITDDTRIFVADPVGNVLTEVKDIHVVVRLLGYDKLDVIEYVYASYDDDSMDANVVVFNKITPKEEVDSELLRVVAPAGNDYKVTFENTKGETKVIDLKDLKNKWPLNFDLEKYDVVEVFANLQGIYGDVDVLIDSSEDMIVKVAKYDEDNDTILLMDENDATLEYKVAEDFDLFLENEDLEGQVVQFALNADGEVAVISILPATTALDGELEGATPARNYTATLVKLEDLGDGTKVMTVKNETDNQGNEIVKEQTVEVTNQLFEELDGQAGEEVSYYKASFNGKLIAGSLADTNPNNPI